ncbi:MAG: hypothetical protein NTV93_18655 [Verrucomicrobia bacterium]|nr:hypothetical protein [Verrucomicrobiota bacterium]
MIASLSVDCSAFGLTVNHGLFTLYTHTERPAPKKPKDRAQCHMMNRVLLGVILGHLRKPNPTHRFFHVYRVLSKIIEREPHSL